MPPPKATLCGELSETNIHYVEPTEDAPETRFSELTKTLRAAGFSEYEHTLDVPRADSVELHLERDGERLTGSVSRIDPYGHARPGLSITLAMAPRESEIPRRYRQPVASAVASPSSSTLSIIGVSTPLPNGFVEFDDSNLKDSMPPFRGVVVPASAASSFDLTPARNRDTIYFTPTVDQALRVGARLPDYLFKEHPDISKRYETYRFQILGRIENGKQVLLVNAFCESPPDWKQRPVMVADGGDCYFRFWSDVESGSISQFEVNSNGE